MVDVTAATRWVQGHIDSGFLPGAVLGVLTRDGVVAVEAFGDAQPEDRYPIFSATKPLVGMVAAQHFASGALSLDTEVTSVIPDFGGGRDDRVTLRHLGSHTCGIPDPDLDDPTPLDQALVAAGRSFVAGTACQYSSLAFQGIARMAERAGGDPWEDQLAAMLTRVGASGLTMDTADTPHVPLMNPEARVDWDSFCEARHPGAGATATVADMLAIAASLLKDDGALVPPATLATMREAVTLGIPDFDTTVPARRSEWAFTWNLRRAMPGLAASDGFGHAGWDGCEFWIHPEHDVAFVLLTNVLGAEALGLDPLTLAAALTD